jgi:hypothetical protein
MTQTEQFRPMLTNYREGHLGSLENAVWVANTISADERKRVAIMAGVTGLGMTILIYFLLRSA